MRQPPRDRHQQHGHELQQHEHRGRGGNEDQRDLAVVGERDGDGCERCDHQRGSQDIAPARPAPPGRYGVAKQRRHRHVVRAAERPERERERREQPIAERQHQLDRLQRRRDRQRDDGAERRRDGEGQDGAGGKPDRRSRRRQQQHLPEVDREHLAAGGASASGRDDVALPVDVALHRIGDADAADQQRGEADEGKKLGEMIDRFQRRRRIGAAAIRQPESGSCALAAATTALAARSLPSGSRRR
jgi:hypothetical protein